MIDWILVAKCVIAWCVFCAVLWLFLGLNSSRISRMDEPFKDPSQIARLREEDKHE